MQHRTIAQAPRFRHPQQRVIGNAAPQEKRQPRRELQIADSIGGAGCDARRILFDPDEKLRAREKTADDHLDSAIEIVSVASVLVEIEQSIDFGCRRRTTECAMRKSGDDRSRAVRLFGGVCRMTREDPASARRVARALRVERTRDRDALDVRQAEVIGRDQRRAEKRLQPVAAFS